MNELKQKVVEYWLSEYRRTKWPFVKRHDIANALGENVDDAIRELRKESKIILRQGINDVLVVYVFDVEIYDEIKHLLKK